MNGEPTPAGISARPDRPPRPSYLSYRNTVLLPLYAGLFLPWHPWRHGGITWPVGGALVLAGAILRLGCMRYMGRSYRTPRAGEKRLVTGGPYARTRNPLYIGNIVMSLGFAVMSQLIWYLPILGAGLILHYVIVARLEEAHLMEKFGPAYLAYRDHVPRWIPRPGSTMSGDPPSMGVGELLAREWRGILVLLAFTAALAAKLRWLM